MPIEFTAPTFPRKSREIAPQQVIYTAFLASLRQELGKWASLPLDEVGGKTKGTKQSALHRAGNKRGMRLQTTVQTTVQGDRIYARWVGSSEVLKFETSFHGE